MADRRGAGQRRKTRFSKHLNFSVFEVAKALHVTRGTVRRWIKVDLKTVDGNRPFLIGGADLNAFLQAQKVKAKRPCQPGHIYCLKCREARRPVPGLVDYIWNGRTTGNLQAICDHCGTVMNRRCAKSRIPEVLPNLDVSMRQG